MGGECLLITLKWGRDLQMENWVEARGWGDQLLSRGGVSVKKSDKQKKDTGFNSPPPKPPPRWERLLFLGLGRSPEGPLPSSCSSMW